MDQTASILDLSKIYDMVEKFVSMKEYDKDLQDELTAAYPKYTEVLKAARRDLTRPDCGIVIAGETSAGKTSLINILVQQKKLFVTSNLAATGKICRIRNSEQIGLSLYNKDDTLIKEETTNNIRSLRKIIETYTDINNQDTYYVDICLPVSLLKGNVIIVDTPGIGETTELDQILMDFLPHAVSFIFVINAHNAGGIHEDRLSKIFEDILENQAEMPCFDPRSVLFLTNKWDCIDGDSSDEDDSSDDDDSNEKEEKRKLTEIEKTWNTIQEKLKKGWNMVSPDRIFKLSLKQVAKGKQTKFTEEYKRFERVLQETIEINQNKRIEFYFSFLKNFTENAERGTLARIHFLENDEEEQRETIERNKKEIEQIKQDCESKKASLLQFKTEIVKKMADRLHTYINSDEGKMQILSRQGRSDISSVSYSQLRNVIPERMNEGIQMWCQGQECKTILDEVTERINSCVRDICSKIKELETEMTGIKIDFKIENLGLGAVIGCALLGTFSVAFTVSTFVGLFVGRVLVDWLSSKEDHLKEVNEVYNKCLSKLLPDDLYSMVFKSIDGKFRKIVWTIFYDKIPKELANIKKINEQLWKKQSEIRNNRDSFERLHEVIKEISRATDDYGKRIGMTY